MPRRLQEAAPKRVRAEGDSEGLEELHSRPTQPKQTVAATQQLPTISLTANRRFGMAAAVTTTTHVDNDEWRHDVRGSPARSESSSVGVGHAPAALNGDEDDDGAMGVAQSPTTAGQSDTDADLLRLVTMAEARKGASALSVRQRLAEMGGAKESFCDVDSGFLSFGSKPERDADDDDDEDSLSGSSSSTSSGDLPGLEDDEANATEATKARFKRESDRADRAAVRAAAELSLSDSEDEERAEVVQGANAAAAADAAEVASPTAADDDDEAYAAALAASMPGKAPASSSSHAHRQQLHGITMQTKSAFGYATTTIVALSNPLTVRAPCAVWAVAGAASIGGYVIQPSARAQWAMIKPSSATASSPTSSSPPQQQDEMVSVTPLPQKKFSSRHKAADADARYDAAVAAMESAVGPVDWPWVAKVTSEWKNRMGSLPTTVLLVERAKEIDTSKAAHKRARFGQPDAAAGAFANAPPCLARRIAPFAAAPLFTEAVPAMLKAPPANTRVVVVGQQGVGKSTIARELSNAFISRYGGCLFLDLDAGQGELTPPGTFALALLTAPLLAVSSTAPPLSILVPPTSLAGGATEVPGKGVSRVLSCVYVGSTVIRDPCVASQALARIVIDARAAMAQWSLPLVVNTHGWIHGTGRRLTVDAIQRIRPSHVIHLQLDGDEDWIGEMGGATGRGSLADPASGLSAAAIANCGTQLDAIFGRLLKPAAAEAAATAKRQQPLQFELLRMAVKHQFVKPANARIAHRTARWAEYFDRSNTALSAPFVFSEDGNDAPTVAAPLRLRVPLARVALFATEADDVVNCSTFDDVKRLLTDSLVGIAVAKAAPSPGGDTAARLVNFVTDHGECPAVVGFGVVVAIEGTSERDAVLVLRSPVPAATAKAVGCNALVVGFQQVRLK